MKNKSDLIRGVVVGAGTLALAGALWLAFDSPDDGEARSADAAPTAVVRPPDEASLPEPSASGPGPEDVVAPAPDGAASTAAASAVSAGRVEVPAAPVTPGTAEPAAASLPTPPVADGPDAVASAEANVDLVLDQREPDAGDDVRSDGPNVVVPTSYPVSEAARYFVPREERRPGNLGGPPPLDFPGGPNDPNGPGGLAPPPAPGG